MSTKSHHLSPPWLSSSSQIINHNSLDTINFEYRTIVEQFSKRRCTIESDFSSPETDKSKFCLLIRPNYVDEEKEKANNSNSYSREQKYPVSIRLKVVSMHRNELYLEAKTSIIDSVGNYCHTNEIKKIFHISCLNGSYSEIDLLVKDRSVLLNQNGTALLKNDTLTLHCELTYSFGSNRQQVVEPLQVETTKLVKECATKFTRDFNYLLNDGILSDVTLVFGEKELNAHKAILAARSPVFEAMFTHAETKEAQENRVEITDVSYDVFSQLLRYIYTGIIPKGDENLADLFIASDKYQLDPLKAIYETYLCAQLSTESMISLLKLADMYSAPKLKEKTLDFIANCTTVQDTIKALFATNQAHLLLDSLQKINFK